MGVSTDLELLDKIVQLPPDRRAEVERLVDFLHVGLVRTADGSPSGGRTLKELLLASAPRSAEFAAVEPAATLTCRETLALD